MSKRREGGRQGLTALTAAVMADATLGPLIKDFAATVPTGAVGEPRLEDYDTRRSGNDTNDR